ncbi:MAG: glycosyltransferase family 2 protein [Leptolyngbya sp. SIOISBB]|nr:glycosyltransferase family 2 protein [Leptolyngbya sp. SIOISBB]
MGHVDITVAICTYNGAVRIPDVLDALNLQQATEHLVWEVLVIDNASQDNTHEVVQQYANQDNGKYLLRYAFEPQKGLAFARNRAVLEACGNLVAFLDDDNIPASNWILKATEFAQKSPKAGAFGGKVKGQFETPPPKDFNKIAVFLAILDRGEVAHCYTPHRGVFATRCGLSGAASSLA